MDLELEWSMGAQCLAQRGTHRRTDFCDALDSNKVGYFSRRTILDGGGSGRSWYPAEAVSPRPVLRLESLDSRNERRLQSKFPDLPF
jgi:hypothetical protein